MTPLKANQLVTEILTAALSIEHGEIPDVMEARDEIIDLLDTQPHEVLGVLAALTAYAVSTTRFLAQQTDSDPLVFVRRRAIGFEANSEVMDQMLADWIRDHPGGLT